MAHIGSKWRLDRPTDELDITMPVMPEPSFIARTFVPDAYESRYPYPLLVLFHPHGSNEDQVLDLVPRMSRRNFFACSIRGPEFLGSREDGKLAFGWGNDTKHSDLVNDYVIQAVESVRRTHHIHSERVYFVGICEGAAAAYRAAFAMPDRIGGVAALNGSIPKVTPGSPLFNMRSIRKMRVLIGHGLANSIVPLSTARRDFNLLYAAGANVRLRTYMTTNRLHNDMFNDVNRWVIGAINAETDRLVKCRR